MERQVFAASNDVDRAIGKLNWLTFLWEAAFAFIRLLRPGHLHLVEPVAREVEEVEIATSEVKESVLIFVLIAVLDRLFGFLFDDWCYRWAFLLGFLFPLR